jgi:excisionase family DNA binding protein
MRRFGSREPGYAVLSPILWTSRTFSVTAPHSGISQLLKIEEAADRLRVSVRNIRHQIYRRKIPIVKIGRLVRIDERDLQDFIERGRIPAER